MILAIELCRRRFINAQIRNRFYHTKYKNNSVTEENEEIKGVC